MQKIKLNNEKFAIVDDRNFEYLNQFKWTYDAYGYAVRRFMRNGKRTTIFMHNLIIDIPKGYLPDHINGNRIDNRKENLRIANYKQNNQNRRLGKNNTSGYKGVSWSRLGKGYWKAYIKQDKKSKFLGNFKTKEEAALAYNEAAKKYFGEFAWLNEMKGELN